MTMSNSLSLNRTPAGMLLAALLASLAICVLAAWFALREPWLGLGLQAKEGTKGLIVVSSRGPAREIPRGAQLVRIAPVSEESLDLRADDLIEEPDFFDTYPQMREFYARQSRIDGMLHGAMRLYWRDLVGIEKSTLVTPTARPLDDLPAVFWFQLFAGTSGFFIAFWVFVLRPYDWGARMFALTGLMFPFFTVPAAIYSTRELAMPGGTFRVMASLNHFGAFMFGCALAAIFLCYPRQIVKPRILLGLPVVFGLWLIADILQLAPNQDWGSRLPVMAEMLLAIVLAFVQWRNSRYHPIDRAALRWFILSSVVGCGLFVFSTAGASMLGLFPPLSQGYSFGFFLIMYAGLALGLRRYRLFDLDEWAYRILLWVGSAAAVILMDAALMFMLGFGKTLSLGVTLFICGWLYFPLRQWLWQRISGRRDVSLEAVLPELTRIAFSTSDNERNQLWDQLLNRLYDPLETLPGDASSPISRQPSVESDGIDLYIPACSKLSARLLRYSHRGKRLFSPRDALFVDSLYQLMEQAAAGREAYERGIVQERKRIAQDMHDDIGARLLMLAHRLRDPKDADIARAAIRDLRTTIGALNSQAILLGDALADWRAEAESRCEAAGVVSDWRQPDEVPRKQLHPRERATLERVLREAISNALKHAAPRSIRIGVFFDKGMLEITVEDDGDSTSPECWDEGHGMRSMRGRLNELGGKIEIVRGAQTGTRLAVNLPLENPA